MEGKPDSCESLHVYTMSVDAIVVTLSLSKGDYQDLISFFKSGFDKLSLTSRVAY
jgi:hypothetical protein